MSATTKAEKKRRAEQSARDKAAASAASRRDGQVLVRNVVAPTPPKPKKVARHPYTEMILDPFSVVADGFPDEFNGATQTIVVNDTLTLTTNASGCASMLVLPDLDNYWSLGTWTAGAFTSWASSTAHDKQTALAAEFKFCRLIAQGIRVTWMGAPSTASGRVVVMPMVGLTSGDTGTDYDDWFDAPYSVECTPSELPVEYHQSPYDRPAFNTVTSTANTYFPGCLIAVVGAPASTMVLSVETVTHVEGTPFNTTLNARSAKPTPAHPAAVAAAANAAAMGPFRAEDSAKAGKARRAAVDATFASLGLGAEAAGVPYGALIAEVPGAFRRVRKAIKGFMA